MSIPRPGAVVDPGLVRTRAGAVAEFDEPSGIGTVRDRDGAVHPFHCTAIADGSRSIAVGTGVRYVLVTGHGGAFEARDIVPATRRAELAPDLSVLPFLDD